MYRTLKDLRQQLPKPGDSDETNDVILEDIKEISNT
jgi:hypothetical protein